MKQISTSALPLGFLLSVLCLRAGADVPTVIPDRVLAASDAASYDVLGYGLAVDDSTLLVGSRGCDTPQVNSGAVYAYRRIASTWTQTQKLVFNGAQRDDQIGSAVALSGTIAVAGAPGRGASGAAFILRFDGGTWFSQAEVSDASLSTGSAFGSAVACLPTVIAIGAPNSSEGVGAGAGRVRIYDRPVQTWVQGQLLKAPFPDPGDQFGSAVALSGDLLAIAAPGDDDFEINSGAVYLYKRIAGQFQLRAKIFSPLPVTEDSFGRSVALSGTTLVVGAYRSDLAALNGGAVFVYNVSAEGLATYTRTLLPPATAINAEFGNSVATDGAGIIVGAPGFATSGALHGASWVYLNGDTIPEAMLTSAGGSSMDLCGTRVAISSVAAVAGAPGMQVGILPSAGTTLLFDRLRDCNGSGIPDAIEIATGALSDANSDGIPDACQCIGDFTGDGFVNGGDLGIMLGVWGLVPTNFPQVDLNRDGTITGADLGLLLSNWGPCS